MKHLGLVLAVTSIVACATPASVGAPTGQTRNAVVPARASEPLGSHTSGAPVDDGRLQAGHALFTARCQRCHALPAPARLSPQAWPAAIVKMARKSGLSSDQVVLITDYLVAAASRS